MAEPNLMESDQLALRLTQSITFPQDYVEEWGADNMMLYDAAIVEALSISTASKRFLTEIGFKRRAASLVPRWVPCPLSTLPVFGRVFGDKYNIPSEFSHYRVFDISADEEDLEAFLCIDEKAEGRIMSVQTQWYGYDKIDTSYLNASILQYAEFLLTYMQYSRWGYLRQKERQQFGRPLPHKEVEMLGKSIRQKLLEIDPTAFATTADEYGDLIDWEKFLLSNEADMGCSL